MNGREAPRAGVAAGERPARTISPRTAVTLVAGREVNTRLRTKSFYISTLVLLAAMAGFVFLQTTLASNSDKLEVGLSGQAAALAQPLTEQGARSGVRIDVTEVDEADGVAQVREEELDALVTGPPSAPKVTGKDDVDETLRRVLTDLARQQTLNGRLAEANLDPAEVQATIARTTVDISTVEPSDPLRGQRTAIGIVIAVLLYISLLTYGNTVTQGVVEEKSSRVVEVLLATVRPWQLLLGKVLGIGVVGLAQMTILFVLGGGLAVGSGAIDLPATTVGTVLAGLLWYVLGFLLYAMVFAGGGALVSRQEDTQQVATPITMVIVVGFVLGISLLGDSPNGTLTVLMSLLPPFAPILMPGRIAIGGVAPWEIAVSVVLLLAAIAGATWLAGRIYRNAVLRTGSRVSLREALR